MQADKQQAGQVKTKHARSKTKASGASTHRESHMGHHDNDDMYMTFATHVFNTCLAMTATVHHPAAAFHGDVSDHTV